MPGSTTRGVPYPIRSDPIDSNPATAALDSILGLAQYVDDKPGIAVLTTTQRNALAGAALWAGRVIRNTTTGQYEYYTGSVWAPFDPVDRAKVIKAADESVTSSTVAQNDDHLVLPVVANTRYHFEALLHVVTDAAPDFKLAFDIPAGATMIWQGHIPGGAGGTTIATGFVTGDGTTGSIVVATGTYLLAVAGLLSVGGTAGNLQLQWAQDTGSGTATTVKAGSTLTTERVRAA